MKKTGIALIVALTFVIACESKSKDAPEPEAETTEEGAVAQKEGADAGEPTSQPSESASKDEADEKAGPVEDIASGKTRLYGDRFTVIEPPKSLAAALQQHEKTGHAGPYKVEARVGKVCKKKGCWFELSGESVDRDIRVRMKDYGFFVPRNSDGAQAIVEGELATRELSQKEAQHYADDAAEDGEEPKKVEGPREVYEFTATSVEITKS